MNTDILKRWPGRALWHLPWPFRMAQVLCAGYSLRCVVFHDVSDQPSSFTRGIGVTLTPRDFEDALRFLIRHYTPVSLDEALGLGHGGTAPPRPVLVTFDDAYASVALRAAPLCRQDGVPALFFVNARFLDNRDLALDNLICHVVNTRGYETVSAVAAEIVGSAVTVRSFRQIFGALIPSLTLRRREALVDLLAGVAGKSREELAADACLYLTAAQLRALTSSRFEIGDHTYSHVHGRILRESEFGLEVDGNRSVLESVTGTAVRSFSLPYGSSADLTPDLARHLERSGYEAVFLVERLMNTTRTDLRRFHRVSLQPGTDADRFSELEVLPRLRALRSALVHTTGAPASRSH